MESCLVFAPSICVTWKSDLQFWEVAMTALISALTIVASVFIARSVAKNEVRRQREADRRARRSQIIGAFSETATDLLHRDHGLPVSVLLANFSARVSPLLDPEDFEAHAWMQDTISEMIDVQITGDRQDGEKSAPEWVLGERIDDLRAWARWEGTWTKYLEFVEARPVRPWRESAELAPPPRGDIPEPPEASTI